MFHKGESPFFGSFSDSKYSLSVQRKGDKCRAAQRLRIKGDKCRVGSRRLRFCTSVSHFGACALRFYTSLLHFGAERVDPYKTFRQGRPPKIIGEKNRKISQFLLSLNFPIFLAKSSSSSLESSKSEVNQSFKFRPADLFKSVSFSVLSSGVFFPFWIIYIIQIF